VQNLSVTELSEPELSMFAAQQKEDLARMYRLFARIPKGLDPVADSFRRHVEADGLALVKEATEAAAAKAAAGALIVLLRDAGGRKIVPV